MYDIGDKVSLTYDEEEGREYEVMAIVENLLIIAYEFFLYQ